MRHRHPLLTVLAIVFALVGTACGDAGNPPGTHAAKGAPSGGLEFTASTLDSQPFNGVTLAGKPTVLWFWEPSCSACRAQAPEVALTADLHDGSVSVVGVAGAGGSALHKEFATSTGTHYLRHLADPDKKVWNRFDVTKPGTYVLLDASGEVVMRGDGLNGRLAKEVSKLVG
ncbi:MULTISPECIES: redoxin family protein [unclassified Streptomyces]|uniref:redoxin family protein n=1 Tax=unclassified Streptomyces TaxID=2593676 RepID=UPI0029676165|nr:redoxin family protein [Streptomyces sp. SJL17-1]